MATGFNDSWAERFNFWKRMVHPKMDCMCIGYYSRRKNVFRYISYLPLLLLLIGDVIGALVIFYPYTFKDGDLSRYQYAKQRWVVHEMLSEALWPLKAQLDTLTQCFANSVILACPILLSALNTTESLHPLEVVGFITWCIAWIFENMADVQKIHFLKSCKLAGKTCSSNAEKMSIKAAVLGLEPYDGSKYWLWTRCRHPNYFFEWLSWIGFAIMGFGSVVTKDKWLMGGEGVYMTVLLTLSLLLMLRFFYDCLVYWTGAAPAEQQSVRKRPRYRDYQAKTRVIFPFAVPEYLVEHHMSSGWPLSSEERHEEFANKKDK
jgi:steroid 5-alpha reductase family enzyme